jgi:quercetin dioxygenase-like cupin family protein
MGSVAILDTAPSREQIERLEDYILQVPQVDLQTTHALSGGVYARTIFIPEGTVLTGAAHKKDHINVMQGDITVWTEEGMKRLTGQHVLTTKAGAKRAGLAHADTWWTTICATALTDIDEIEDELVENADRLQTRTLELHFAPVAQLES